MNVFESAVSILTSPYVPSVFFRTLVRGAVRVLRRQVERGDARQVAIPSAVPAPKGPLYLVDGYHGGVVFWDWLGLPDGGLWYLYNWPLCIQTVLDRGRRDGRLKAVFEFDAYTYEDMARKAPRAVAEMREAIAAGRLEIVNGTYAQPLTAFHSGESFLRQLAHGLAAVKEALGAEVRVFYSQEPSYFPQLPQILDGFGFKGVVFRTQWAAFGTDPAHDAAIVLWEGPDGSIVRAVPRYSFQHYDRLRQDHPGLANMALAAGKEPDSAPESLAPFEEAARKRGITHPLVSELKDANLPDAPLPWALAVAGLENVRFVTLSEYFALASGEGPRIHYELDEIPATLPWGLQAETLLRRIASAEGRLLAAERLDAVVYMLGRPSAEKSLEGAWKNLCLAQQHDLHVCGPWHSRRHGKSMAEVGADFALDAERSAVEVAGEALCYLAERLDGGILVFNPSPWPRRDYVEVSMERQSLPNHLRLVIREGKREIPYQIVEVSEDLVVIGFIVELPSYGYKCLTYETGEKPPESIIETGDSFYLAQINPDGSLSLSSEGKALISAGNFFTLWRDGWRHDSRQGINRVELIETGPIYRRYLAEGKISGIQFRQFITLYRDVPRIDLRVMFDFGQKGVYLGPQPSDNLSGRAMSVQDEKKLCVNFVSSLKNIYCDAQFLITETKKENIVGLHWVGLENNEGTNVAFLNRGTRGYFYERDRGMLRNVLAWGPESWIYASDNSITRGRSRYTALKGRQTFEYAILPYKTRLEAQKAALDFQLPLMAQTIGAKKGSLPSSKSFLAVEPDQIIITSIFVRNGKIYARLWNASGEAVRAVLNVDGGARLWAVDLHLEHEEALSDFQVPMRPWGIQTVRIALDGKRGETG